MNQVVDQVVNTLLALQTNEKNDNSELNNECNDIKVEVSEDDVKKEHDIEKIRNGWSIYDCGTLSIGDLYLMFGCDSKIILEYSWDLPVECKSSTSQLKGDKLTENENKMMSEVVCDISTDNTEEEINQIEASNDLANTLKRLISIAKLHYRKNIVKCPCGHVCNGNKQNVVKCKPPIIKMTKVPEYKAQENAEIIATNVTSTSEINVTPQIAPVPYQPLQITSAPLFRIPNMPNDMLRAQLDVSKCTISILIIFLNSLVQQFKERLGFLFLYKTFSIYNCFNNIRIKKKNVLLRSHSICYLLG